MGGVYGDMLAFFGEQARYVNYFSMNTDTVAGYSDRQDLGKVRGVFQNMKRGDLLRENDTESDVLVPTFWTRQKLKVGNFLEICDDEEGADLFRITSAQAWRHEGGFHIYIMETVSGNTDRQVAHDDVQLGNNGGYW